jgi:2,4-dienoyl-CoA reductase-like NADH-dependent reductase (Old Yellow Enzyme family)
MKSKHISDQSVCKVHPRLISQESKDRMDAHIGSERPSAPEAAAASGAQGGSEFDVLLSPLKVGGITLRNRVVFGPHGTGFGTDGNVPERLVAYQRERARGGVGLVILEATAIDESPIGVTGGLFHMRNIDDRVLPSYRRVADVVHAEGARIFCLLSHSGRVNTMGANGAPPKAPSPLPMDRTRDIPHELEIDEIAAIVQQFAAAARRCREGGLDGVSLSFAHGNLVQEFLSPESNHRTDEYGGSEENRLRMAREVLQACREAVGPDFILGIRFSADELVADGYHLEDGVRYAKLFQEWGKLDFIDVSAGTNASMWSRSKHYPTIAEPYAPLVHMARAIRQVVPVPVFVVGKIGDAHEAARIVNEGSADAVVMVRAQIAEPELVAKIKQGAFDDIRECIYCNEGCFGRQQRFIDITCIYNQRSGREIWWEPLARTDAPKRVVVVGAGPAGLEAARVAAKRGHSVVLYEKGDVTGGQVRLAAETPHRAGYARMVDWIDRQARKHGAEIRLGSTVSADDVLAAKPDVVIVATGSSDQRPPIPGADLPNVASGREVLAGDVGVGKRVVIGDWDGRYQGTSIAEKLALAGHEVHLVSSAFFIGQDVDLLTWRPLYERLLDLGVRMYPLEEVVEATAEGARVKTMNHKVRLIAADTVVLCSRGIAERGLYHDLKGRVPALHAIGDSWAPRQIEQAIYEGAKVAREL